MDAFLNFLLAPVIAILTNLVQTLLRTLFGSLVDDPNQPEV